MKTTPTLFICLLFQVGYCTVSNEVPRDPPPVESIVQTEWGSPVRYGKVLGEKYKGARYDHLSLSEKKEAVIKNICMQNAIAGAGAGIFGIFGAPAGIAASLALQVSLVSAIATLEDLDVYDPEVTQLMATVLAGDIATEGLKNSLRAATLFTLVPGLGSIIGFATDGGLCYTVARTLDFALLGSREDGSGPATQPVITEPGPEERKKNIMKKHTIGAPAVPPFWVVAIVASIWGLATLVLNKSLAPRPPPLHEAVQPVEQPPEEPAPQQQPAERFVVAALVAQAAVRFRRGTIRPHHDLIVAPIQALIGHVPGPHQIMDKITDLWFDEKDRQYIRQRERRPDREPSEAELIVATTISLGFVLSCHLVHMVTYPLNMIASTLTDVAHTMTDIRGALDNIDARLHTMNQIFERLVASLEGYVRLAWDDRHERDAKRFQKHCTDLLLTGLASIVFFRVLQSAGLLTVTPGSSFLVRLGTTVHTSSMFLVDGFLTLIGLQPLESAGWVPNAKNIVLTGLYYFFKVTATIFCYVLMIILGIGVCLCSILFPLVAMYLFRSNRLPDYHEQPTFLLLGAGGGGGGAIGYYAVMAMQGHPLTYLILWNVFILAHYLLSTCADQIGPAYYRRDRANWQWTAATKIAANGFVAFWLPYLLAVYSY